MINNSKFLSSLPSKLFFAFSVFLLAYLLFPGPSSIKDFPALPNSIKSTLDGDTVQVPNVSAYFSNNYRDFVTSYYRNFYHNLTYLPFSPIKLNYPPEFAYTAIKDQTQSTYLEEYVYPLKDSLFVNGMEPFYQDGQPKYKGAYAFDVSGTFLETKATLRFYPSPIWAKIILWMGILVSLVLIWKLAKKIIFNR